MKLNWTDELSGLIFELGGKDAAGNVIPDDEFFAADGRIDPLLGLDGCRQLLAELDKEIRVHVLRARRAERSWDDIGTALGISRQAAHKRFSR